MSINRVLNVNLRQYFLLSILIFLCTVVGAEEFYGGLGFNSYSVPKDQRTSLNLTANGEIRFKNGFYLEFDIALLKQWDFGYVFRLFDENERSIDLVYTPNVRKDSLTLEVINQGSFSSIKFHISEKDSARNKWNKIVIFFDGIGKKIVFNYNDKQIIDPILNFNRNSKLQLVFGANVVSEFVTTDVPGFSLKNVKLLNTANEIAHHWPLCNHTGNTVNDIVGDLDGIVSNPNWLINNHFKWRKLVRFKTSQNSGITFDSDRQVIVNTRENNIVEYKLVTNELKERPYENGFPDFTTRHSLVYDSVSKRLVAYDLKGELVAFLDSTYSWRTNYFLPTIKGIYQHNTFVDSEGRLILTGGYDFLKYSSSIHLFNIVDEKWEMPEIKQRPFFPRYLHGAGFCPEDSTFYIFGGYGNEKGEQQLGMQNFYSLEGINTKSFSSSKKWNLNNVQNDFVPVNNLCFVAKDSVFYTLCYSNHRYNTNLGLYQFNVNSPKFEVISDSIPYLFKDIESDANLYFNKSTSEFVAYTKHYEADSAVVNVYSLVYPPVEICHISNTGKWSKVNWYLLFFMLVLIVVVATLLINNKKKKGNKQGSIILKEEDIIPPPVKEEKDSTLSITWFGQFKITDVDGSDLTSQLSPRIKELFILLVLESLSSGGVTSKKLTQKLWMYLDAANAKNTRNVSISKLRKSLKQFAGVNLEYINRKYQINLGEGVYSDYHQFLKLTELFRLDSYSQKEIEEFSSILHKGMFLPNHNFEWLDLYKELVLNLALDSFDEITSSGILKEYPNQLLKLSDAILMTDNLNEFAFLFKMYSYRKAQKKTLGRIFYEHFFNDYIRSYDKNLTLSFEECWNIKYEDIFTISM